MTAARSYLRRGWVPVPIPARKKSPSHPGWQNRTLESSRATLDRDFPADADTNVGVLLGAPSDWLVDVDLDHAHALKLAPSFLPPTIRFGRASKPESHWLYKCIGVATSKREKVEVRSTGGQTVFPGSVHECGEAIEWCNGDETKEPAEVSADTLGGAVDRLRAACAIAACVPGVGERHEFFIRVAGALSHLGWLENDATSFVEAICQSVDADSSHHAKSVADTYQRRRDGVSVSGIPKLLEAGVPSKSINALRRASPAGDERDSIIWGPGRELAASDDVITHLGKEHDIFQRSGKLVTALDGKLKPLPKPVLRGRIDAACRLVQRGKEGEMRAIPPPDPLVAAVHERGTWPSIRSIDAVVNYPVLRPDGTLAVSNGFDEATCTWLADVPKLNIPAAPTLDDAQQAVADLHDLIAQFPFEGEPGLGLSVWLAFMLTLLARPSIDGSVPAFIFDASTSRSGKSLLVKTAGIIVLGDTPHETHAPKSDDAEWGKLIHSIALEAPPLLFLDNVTGRLQSAALDGFITSGGAVKGRTLGVSETSSIERCPTVVAITSNNATLSVDLIGRSLHARIDRGVEAPGLLSGWKYHPLELWVKCNRARYLAAAATILRAHAIVGRPSSGQTLGGFEAWSEIVAGALDWVGLPDPVSSQAELRDTADDAGEVLGTVFTLWRAQFENKTINAGELLREALPELRAALSELVGSDIITPAKLGAQLRQARGRVVGELRLKRVGRDRTRGTVWRVEGK